MYIAAHTVVIARNAGHLLFHAVRLSRAVLIAAILKTDNKSSSLYTCSFPPHKHTHTVHSQQQKKRSLFYSSMAVNWKAERVQRGEITHGDSEAHSLTCKSPQCRTGNAWGYLLKADKKNSALLFNCNYQEKLLNMVGNTLGGELALLWASVHLGLWAVTYTGRTSCSPPRRPCSRRNLDPPPPLGEEKGMQASKKVENI